MCIGYTRQVLSTAHNTILSPSFCGSAAGICDKNKMRKAVCPLYIRLHWPAFQTLLSFVCALSKLMESYCSSLSSLNWILEFLIQLQLGVQLGNFSETKAHLSIVSVIKRALNFYYELWTLRASYVFWGHHKGYIEGILQVEQLPFERFTLLVFRLHDFHIRDIYGVIIIA